MTVFDRFVQVSASLIPVGSVQRDFGRTLLVTTDEDLRPPANRTVTVNRIADLLRYVGSTSSAYRSAARYFQQRPYPKRLVVGRWARTGAGGRIVGGDHATLTAIKALNDASIDIDGTAVGSLDFSGDDSFSDFAANLQTKIRGTAPAKFDEAVVSYENGKFIIDLGLDGSGDPYDFDGLITGTNAGDLGLDDSSGATVLAGYAAETEAEGLAGILASDDSAYWGALDGSIIAPDEITAWANAISSADMMQVGLDFTGADVLAANESSSLAATISALGQDRVYGVWSGVRDDKALSFAGRMSSVDFQGEKTIVNPFGRQLPGTTPDQLTSDQLDELERKRINVYAGQGSDAIFIEGWTLNPDTWIDIKYFLDWIRSDIHRRMYDGAVKSPRGVPASEDGISRTLSIIGLACRQGVRNGGLTPGEVPEEMAADIRSATGNREFNGYMTLGYIVHAGPITRSQAGARRAPTYYVWLNGSQWLNSFKVGLLLAG